MKFGDELDLCGHEIQNFGVEQRSTYRTNPIGGQLQGHGEHLAYYNGVKWITLADNSKFSNYALATHDHDTIYEPILPPSGIDAELKYLNGNRLWSEIQVSPYSFMRNLYLSHEPSIYGGSLSNEPDTPTPIDTLLIANAEEIIGTFVGGVLEVDTIDKGTWTFNLNMHVELGFTAIVDLTIEVYSLNQSFNQVLLFSKVETEQAIPDQEEQFVFSYDVPSIPIDPTFKLIVVLKAESHSDCTLTIKTGPLCYITMPYRMSHTILSEYNKNPLFQHINASDRTILNNTSGENTGDQIADGTTITGTGKAGDPFVGAPSGMSAEVYDTANKKSQVEVIEDRLSEFQDTPDDVHYPSEKLVKDSLDLKADITHNHNLNDLAEKSYNSLTDTPSLDFEPADANIQGHINDWNIHVTPDKTNAWDAKLDVSTVIPSLDTIDKMLIPAINEVNAIAKGAGNGETVTDIEDLVILLNAAAPTDYPYGKNFYVVDTEVPDYWISAIGSSSVPYVYVDDTTFLDDIAITGSLQVGYYSISELESQKVDLTDYYDKNAADLLLGAKEDITNKSSNVDTDKTSTTKYANVKAIYDWAVGKFIDLTKIVTSWNATTLNTNIPSEKLVKDSLDLKADITPANGSTSALRALFEARGVDPWIPANSCVYESGFYKMNGLSNITEDEMIRMYNYHTAFDITGLINLGGSTINIRTNFIPQRTTDAAKYTMQNCFINSTFVVLRFLTSRNTPIYNRVFISSMSACFRFCSRLTTINEIMDVTDVTAFPSSFYSCPALVNIRLHGVKANILFYSCSALSFDSLQYLITNRNPNATFTIGVDVVIMNKISDEGAEGWSALKPTGSDLYSFIASGY